jgi:hypothetical protein
LVQAVVAILVELSVLVKMVELIRGCEVNVVTPLKLEVEVSVPMVMVPVVKLVPIFMKELVELAFITLTDKVETFRTDTFATETFAVEKFCVPDHVLVCVLT